jgi:fructose-1,6-bisphosphatase/sedoheptulose 1,7-bisphosphatase-like protein
MEKLAVGPGVDPRRISLKHSVAHNLEAIANCLGKPVRYLEGWFSGAIM